MSESDGLHFDHAISITAAPTQVLSAFFDSHALSAWWNVTRSVTAPRPLGIYAVEWNTTPFQDDVLGTLGGVFYGTVMEFRHGREFFLADAYWLPPASDRPHGTRSDVPCRGRRHTASNSAKWCR